METPDANISAENDFDSYMASHFDFEYETVAPVEAQVESAGFKLFRDVADVSLSNPYAYTVDNSRSYDYTEEEESIMKEKFDSVCVSPADVISMGLREVSGRFSNRFEFIPLSMQKKVPLKRNEKKKLKKKALATSIVDAGTADNVAVEPIERKKRKKRPSQKKRIVLDKIRRGVIEDFNVKVKSKVWKDWVGK